jgi:hypothetical protein
MNKTRHIKLFFLIPLSISIRYLQFNIKHVNFFNISCLACHNSPHTTLNMKKMTKYTIFQLLKSKIIQKCLDPDVQCLF